MTSSNILPPKENPYFLPAPPELAKMDISGLQLRVATTVEEIIKAQEIRYQVFYEELGAKPVENMESLKRDYDEFDHYCTHLLVVDTNGGEDKVVGTYRMFFQEMGKDNKPFYSESEFDISKLKANGKRFLEVGRSCIIEGYRTRFALQLLWQGLGTYVFHHDIDFLFGCASFDGIDVNEHAMTLSYLYHYHLAREEIRPRALDELFQSINIIPKDQIDQKTALRDLPPLIKGYLRLNGVIGDGAMIDKQFNTVDICIMVEKATLGQRYIDYYLRDRSKPE